MLEYVLISDQNATSQKSSLLIIIELFSKYANTQYLSSNN